MVEAKAKVTSWLLGKEAFPQLRWDLDFNPRSRSLDDQLNLTSSYASDCFSDAEALEGKFWYEKVNQRCNEPGSREAHASEDGHEADALTSSWRDF